jgi:hypothetical protein
LELRKNAMELELLLNNFEFEQNKATA